jgi:predicted regulator of amino acid metabolism with ACT domain
LELQHRLGELAPFAEIKEAAVKMGEAVVNVITHLPSHADVLAA